MIHSQENFYARNSNFPDGPENLLDCSKLSSPGAHRDWFGCLKIFSRSRSNFYLENLSGFSVEESNFAGGEIEFVSASSLFSPNKNIWLEDDSRRGLRHFVPEPALAQNDH